MIVCVCDCVCVCHAWERSELEIYSMLIVSMGHDTDTIRTGEMAGIGVRIRNLSSMQRNKIVCEGE